MAFVFWGTLAADGAGLVVRRWMTGCQLVLVLALALSGCATEQRGGPGGGIDPAVLAAARFGPSPQYRLNRLTLNHETRRQALSERWLREMDEYMAKQQAALREAEARGAEPAELEAWRAAAIKGLADVKAQAEIQFGDENRLYIRELDDLTLQFEMEKGQLKRAMYQGR